MPRYFFSATKSAHEQITSLFDFVWPTATAMWNLRWQVDGFLRAMPTATVPDLHARFSQGADIHGANLKRACVTHTWEEQKEVFAKILLTNSIAIYEGWIEEVLDVLGKNTPALGKALQFPTTGANRGIKSAVSTLTASESTALKISLHPALANAEKYDWANLDAMLLCYRFFKEQRNCEIHRGGVADQKLIDAYNQFSLVASPASLGVAEVPIHTAPLIAKPIKISLRGVVGLTDIVLKIITTLDAELCRSKDSEPPFITKWKTIHHTPKTLSKVPKKRTRQVEDLAKEAGFPKPRDPMQLGNWLSSKGLTRF